MKLKLEQMTTEELRDLNHRIVELLKLRSQETSARQLQKFSRGDHVSFESESGPIKGYIVRVNQKTVTIDSYSPKGSWRVSPSFVKRLKGNLKDKIVSEIDNLVDLFPNQQD